MLILLLVLVGTALVTVSALAQQVLLAWIALAAACLGLLLLVVRWRRERRGTAGNEQQQEPAQTGDDRATQSDDVGSPDGFSTEPAGHAAAEPEEGAAAEVEPPGVDEPAAAPSSAGEDSSVGLVHVIPGRRRYHAPDCRLLDAHPTETVTRDEAAEEGFSACTVCGVQGAMPAQAR